MRYWDIKQRSRFPNTMVISQANDYFADILTHEAVAEGVCPELTWTRIDPGAGDLILDLLRAPVFEADPNTETACGARPEESNLPCHIH